MCYGKRDLVHGVVHSERSEPSLDQSSTFDCDVKHAALLNTPAKPETPRGNVSR